MADRNYADEPWVCECCDVECEEKEPYWLAADGDWFCEGCMERLPELLA